MKPCGSTPVTEHCLNLTLVDSRKPWIAMQVTTACRLDLENAMVLRVAKLADTQKD
jgi:hypothetical protein